jgi:hypothetical protein
LNGHTIIIVVASALLGCAKAEERPEPAAATDAVVSDFQATEERALGFRDEHGYFLVKGPSGWKHHGDALWRTGLALSALSCTAGQDTEAALALMLQELKGGLWRHPSRPTSISMDQTLPLYLAVASRVKRCPERAAFWKPLLALHRDFMAESGNRLNPYADTTLPLDFDYLRDLLLSELDLAGRPHTDRRLLLEAQLWAWVWAVRHSYRQDDQGQFVATLDKAACYRVNLAWVAIETMETLGERVSDNARNMICAETEGMGLATMDEWCGRGGLQEFLEKWQPNVWDVAFQRCPAWEGPDCVGDECAGVDKLVALRKKYAL